MKNLLFVFVEINQEVKQAIPHFYARNAEELFLSIRKKKEVEWKEKSDVEQKRLQEVLDNIQEEIEKQQEMASLIRDDLEGGLKIDDSDAIELDDEMQKQYDKRLEEEMEVKLREKIKKEDEKRKWLLEEVIFAYRDFSFSPSNNFIFIMT